MSELSKEKLTELKQTYGEAFYLLDSRQFRNNYAELKESFSSVYPKFNIAYSYKTNYIPKLCRIVNEMGGYAEVVSEMELELAEKTGVTPSKIIWNGPIKNPEVLRSFLLRGGTVDLDSQEETEYVRKIVEEHPDTVFHIGIRCNFDVNDGVVSRFGFDINSREFEKAVEFAAHTENVRFANMQCHFAKRQLEYWPARAEGMAELIGKLGVIPERIDLGGGLFGKMEDSLKKQFPSDIPAYADYAAAAARPFMKKFGKMENMPELLLEPGSALVGDCMKFVGTVKTIKNIRGKYFASVLGSQKNISMTGVNPPVRVYHTGEETQEYENLDMTGFTCIESDVLYRNYHGRLGLGDTIVIGNCGSYSLVMKPPFILPNFPVLDISEGTVEVIKRKETFEDIFRTFVF